MWRWMILAGVSGAILGACGGGGSANESICITQQCDPFLSVIQVEILTPSCTFSSCHDSRAPSGDMDLTDGTTYTSLCGGTTPCGAVASEELGAGETRVIAGDAQNSLIIKALEDRAGVGIDRMPDSAPALDPALITLIRTWIDNGALNN